jgi:hypothetical protein
LCKVKKELVIFLGITTMNLDKLGVGIIGASPNGGWGTMGHMPALQALPNYEVTASKEKKTIIIKRCVG